MSPIMKQYCSLEANQHFRVGGIDYWKVNDASCLTITHACLPVSDVLVNSQTLEIVQDTEAGSGDFGALELDPEGTDNPYYLTFVDMDRGTCFTIEGQEGFLFVKDNNVTCTRIRVSETGSLLDNEGDTMRATDVCTAEILLGEAVVDFTELSVNEPAISEESNTHYFTTQRFQLVPADHLPSSVQSQRSYYERLMNPYNDLN